jgi:hypothetical protein
MTAVPVQIVGFVLEHQPNIAKSRQAWPLHTLHLENSFAGAKRNADAVFFVRPRHTP